MEHCNIFPTPTNVEAVLGIDANGYEAQRDWPNSYVSVIGIVLYLVSNKIPDISFAVHQCARFTNNPKASHETAVKSKCWYLQGTKDNGLVINTSKKLVVDCYADAYFAGPRGHANTQDHIFARSRTVFVVTFSNYLLLRVSKIQTDIALSTLHSEYEALSHSVRALLPLKSLIKEVILYQNETMPHTQNV